MYKVLPFLVFSLQTATEAPKELIVWNVGQGLWVTATNYDKCLHFDAGGEKKKFEAIFAKLKKLCGKNENLFSFSHWDLDHISYAGRFVAKGLRSCLLNPPGGETKSNYKKRWLEKLSPCFTATFGIQEIMFRKNNQNSNDASRIYIYDKKFLLPGDSPIQSERLWAEGIPKSITTLILGHHGSRTSTGTELLNKISIATMAVASSRSQRYGHPHAETKKRLKNSGISLLETQVWGNIHLVSL
jgi:competence protein ComEC